MNKKMKKRINKRCPFCGEDDYALLDLHRIRFGQEYSESNTLVCCSNCHRKIHNNIIRILAKRYCTSGSYLIHFIENDQEKFEEI
jgi:hypothetical protein